MEPFRTDGHLTDETLAALARGRELDELTRLEAAEHLAFCDACLQRYTDLLATAPLLVPAHSCRESLWVRVRRRTLRLVTSRYATAAAAVAYRLVRRRRVRTRMRRHRLSRQLWAGTSRGTSASKAVYRWRHRSQ